MRTETTSSPRAITYVCIVAGLAALNMSHRRAGAAEPARVSAARRPNVLFIAIDDLNHWVHHLGRNRQAITPNIDRLARTGVTFTHAYCAAPACNPSRTALLSGLRPSTSGIYLNGQPWAPAIREGLTLPHHFQRNGYSTAGAGKIYHGPIRRSEWDEYMDNPPAPPLSGRLHDAGKLGIGRLECDDAAMPDYAVASYIIDRLKRAHDKPFFLACGFYKPHLPWQVPGKYFDLHPLDRIELPPVRENDLADVPPEGVHLARQQGDHAAILETGTWKQAIQAYLAAGTFVDAMVGRVLDALDASSCRDNTIVVLWGDHGWHLGEKEHWRKFALWEEATRAPFIWRVPRSDAVRGAVCERTVDFMSLYPTLCDLAGLDIPAHVEGRSIRTLIETPQAEWTVPAITTHGYMNHAVRTEQWRYIRYARGGEELYDEATDPYEWINLAGRPDHAATKKQLAGFLPRQNAEPAAAGRPDRGRTGRGASRIE